MHKSSKNWPSSPEISCKTYFRSAIERLFKRPAETYRYSSAERLIRSLYRKIHPSPKSSYTKGKVEDYSAINLVPPEQLKAFFSDYIDLLKNIKGNDIGDYLEFGVFNGNSITSMVHAAKQNLCHQMRFFGFDSFEGLPPGSEDQDSGVWEAGFYHCPYEAALESIQKKGVELDEINITKGWYHETLNPKLIKKHSIDNIAIAFVDCDSYLSSKCVLDFLAPLIKSPCIICLDDWKLYDTDISENGEYRSFNEFLEKNPRLKAEEIWSYNRKSKSFLIRPNEQ